MRERHLPTHPLFFLHSGFPNRSPLRLCASVVNFRPDRRFHRSDPRLNLWALLRVGVFDEQFFMYGDDLDLNFRFQQAGYRVVYDGRVQIIHIKGVSSSKEADKMARAVFSATQQFYLKHFNPHGSALVRFKYALLFGAWATLASVKAKLKGHKKARPL